MHITDPEKFFYAWGMWELGRSHGIAQAIEMVEKLLCDEGITAQGRVALVGLYDSLLEAKR
jgi:hypothetical protein